MPVDHPEAGSYDYAGLPFRMSETPPALRRAPLLGEHNAEVYGALGYSPEDLTVLVQGRGHLMPPFDKLRQKAGVARELRAYTC